MLDLTSPPISNGNNGEGREASGRFAPGQQGRCRPQALEVRHAPPSRVRRRHQRAVTREGDSGPHSPDGHCTRPIASRKQQAIARRFRQRCAAWRSARTCWWVIFGANSWHALHPSPNPWAWPWREAHACSIGANSQAAASAFGPICEACDFDFCLQAFGATIRCVSRDTCESSDSN
jgi:hypothetical protein